MRSYYVPFQESQQTAEDQVSLVVIARSLELMPPHGQKSGVREAGVMVLYVLYTWGI